MIENDGLGEPNDDKWILGFRGPGMSGVMAKGDGISSDGMECFRSH